MTLLIKFPDTSPSYTKGFEAGMYFTMMSEGAPVISRSSPVHTDNLEVLSDMAKLNGYVMMSSPYDQTYSFATFVKLGFSSN